MYKWRKSLFIRLCSLNTYCKVVHLCTCFDDVYDPLAFNDLINWLESLDIYQTTFYYYCTKSNVNEIKAKKMLFFPKQILKAKSLNKNPPATLKQRQKIRSILFKSLQQRKVKRSPQAKQTQQRNLTKIKNLVNLTAIHQQKIPTGRQQMTQQHDRRTETRQSLTQTQRQNPDRWQPTTRRQKQWHKTKPATRTRIPMILKKTHQKRRRVQRNLYLSHKREWCRSRRTLTQAVPQTINLQPKGRTLSVMRKIWVQGEIQIN